MTEFQARAGIHADAPAGGAPRMTSREVAEAGYRGAINGKRVVVPGLGNKVVVLANRLLTRRRITRIVRRIQERRRDVARGPSANT